MNLNQQQLAQTFGVSDRTIRQWQNEGLPVEKQAHGGNRYRLSGCIEWVVRRRFGNDLIFEKTRLTKAQADKTEVEIRLLQLQLLNSVDVESTWSTIRDELREEVERYRSESRQHCCNSGTWLTLNKVSKTYSMRHWRRSRGLKRQH